MDKEKMAEWNQAWKDREMAKLDAQGRNRSEWCYAAYDGRKDRLGIPHGSGHPI